MKAESELFRQPSFVTVLLQHLLAYLVHLSDCFGIFDRQSTVNVLLSYDEKVLYRRSQSDVLNHEVFVVLVVEGRVGFRHKITEDTFFSIDLAPKKPLLDHLHR